MFIHSKVFTKTLQVTSTQIGTKIFHVNETLQNSNSRTEKKVKGAKLSSKNHKTQLSESTLFSSLGGAYCLVSRDLVHGSRGALCGGGGIAGLACLSSFSLSINLSFRENWKAEYWYKRRYITLRKHKNKDMNKVKTSQDNEMRLDLLNVSHRCSITDSYTCTEHSRVSTSSISVTNKCPTYILWDHVPKTVNKLIGLYFMDCMVAHPDLLIFSVSYFIIELQYNINKIYHSFLFITMIRYIMHTWMTFFTIQKTWTEVNFASFFQCGASVTDDFECLATF